MIEARGIRCQYLDGVTVFDDLSLSIAQGELVFVTGRSGSGKTTFLRLLLGLMPPSAGELRVAGIDLARPSSADLLRLRRKLGVVFQELRLIRGQSALDNVAVSLRIMNHDVRTMYREAEAALDAVGLGELARRPVERLSWGQQQRVALARAVVRRPAIVLADEPTGNLDGETASAIIDLLVDQQRAGTTVVVTTHDRAAVERGGGRQIRIDRGRAETIESI